MEVSNKIYLLSLALVLLLTTTTLAFTVTGNPNGEVICTCVNNSLSECPQNTSMAVSCNLSNMTIPMCCNGSESDLFDARLIDCEISDIWKCEFLATTTEFLTTTTNMATTNESQSNATTKAAVICEPRLSFDASDDCQKLRLHFYLLVVGGPSVVVLLVLLIVGICCCKRKGACCSKSKDDRESVPRQPPTMDEVNNKKAKPGELKRQLTKPNDYTPSETANPPRVRPTDDYGVLPADQPPPDQQDYYNIEMGGHGQAIYGNDEMINANEMETNIDVEQTIYGNQEFIDQQTQQAPMRPPSSHEHYMPMDGSHAASAPIHNDEQELYTACDQPVRTPFINPEPATPDNPLASPKLVHDLKGLVAQFEKKKHSNKSTKGPSVPGRPDAPVEAEYDYSTTNYPNPNINPVEEEQEYADTLLPREEEDEGEVLYENLPRRT